MRRLISILIPLLVAVAMPSIVAGADGYLRQGPAKAPRFSQPEMPRPLLNIEVVALIRPPAAEAPAAPTVEEPELPLYLTDAVKALIAERVRQLNAQLEVPPTAPVTEVEITTSEPQTSIVDSPALTRSTAITEAGTIDDIMLMLRDGGRGADRRNRPEIIAPVGAFTLPQTEPAPRSRATFTVPGP